MSTPTVSENKLVVAARQHGIAVREKDMVKAGMTTVEAVRDLTIKSDDDDSIMTDHIGVLVRARKAIEAHLAPMKRILNDAKNALLEPARQPLAQLEAAEKVGRAKQAQFRLKKQREIADAQRAAQAKAAEAARETQGPPASVPAPIQEKVVRGAGAASNLTRTVKVEMVNHHECDPSWLALTPAARADAIAARDAGNLQIPDLHENAIEWNGLRVWNEVSTATRA